MHPGLAALAEEAVTTQSSGRIAALVARVKAFASNRESIQLATAFVCREHETEDGCRDQSFVGRRNRA